jgi:hypothetical protein
MFCSLSLLFIIYVNDIPNLTQGKTITYADDTSILNIGRDIKELKKNKKTQKIQA